MAITIDWDTKVINIPKADTTLVSSSPIEIRDLDVNSFRLSLKDLEDSEEGISYLDTHRHNTEVEVGGVVLARVVEIINGYTVTFEDGFYAVNLKGANNNIGDVLNLNNVQVRSTNSAGLVNNADQVATAVWNKDITSETDVTKFGGFIQNLLKLRDFLIHKGLNR